MARHEAPHKASTLKIVIDDLSGSQIARFLDEHVQEMRSIGPPESKHALDLDGLCTPGIPLPGITQVGGRAGLSASDRDGL
jgi:putative acetyltransferase